MKVIRRTIIKIPEPLQEVMGPLVQFGRLAKEKGGVVPAIFAIITAYILEGIFGVIGVITGSILYAFEIVVGAIEFARDLLVGAFGVVGVDLIGALIDVQREILTVVEGAGPAAPVIAAGAAVVSVLILYRLAVAALGELPIGSSIVDLLGLR